MIQLLLLYLTKDLCYSMPIPGRRNGLLQSNAPEEDILQGQQHEQNTVSKPSHRHNTRSGQRIEPEVISSRHDDCEDETRVHDAQNDEERLAELGHALLTWGEATTEKTRVVE